MSLRNRIGRYFGPIDVQHIIAPREDDVLTRQLAIIDDRLNAERVKTVRDPDLIDYLLDRRSALMPVGIRYPAPVIPGGAS
jgi:hypothetical protein